MNTPIKLIVGLGNPGAEYANTRHNAGAWAVEKIADDYQASLQQENKFKGQCGQLSSQGQMVRLIVPSVFMNLSGQSVKAIAAFYKIEPENILVAYDDLDLPPGEIKLKFDGGHGGHNGVRDIINHLGSKQFYRLRIGIGHPGNSKEVTNYVLQKPSKSHHDLITTAINHALTSLPLIIEGEMQKAMKQLHTKAVN